MNFLKDYSVIKRFFDIFLSYIGLITSFPIFILFSFAIWLKDGSPILYIQERVGENGKIFKMIKFRTMGYKKENSYLVNLLRKTALDELPQLINILKGEMSFVGPRPLIPEEVNLVKEVKSRFIVRPGLTGMAQISASKNASLLEKCKYDLWYIENQSLWLEIKIIILSLLRSFKRRWDR